MPEAFVLMNAELGSEESIVNELKKIDLGNMFTRFMVSMI